LREENAATGYKKQKTRLSPGSFISAKPNGAVEKTRTSTSCDTATSTLRVYQFRHDRIVVEPDCSGAAACSKSTLAAQVDDDVFFVRAWCFSSRRRAAFLRNPCTAWA
jgi:hypothetical protein